jgi:hypothetical protein
MTPLDYLLFTVLLFVSLPLSFGLYIAIEQLYNLIDSLEKKRFEKC